MIKKFFFLIAVAIIINLLLIGVICCHHYFVTGLNPFLGLISLVLFLIILIPSIIIVTKKISKSPWLKQWFNPSAAFFLGFLMLITGGFLISVLIGNSTLDIQLHDTMFIIDNTWSMEFLALLFLVFSAIYWAFPKITGREMHKGLAYVQFILTLIPAYTLSWQSAYISVMGMPRRYLDYSNWPEATWPQYFLSTSLVMLLLAHVIFVINLIWSLFRRRR